MTTSGIFTIKTINKVLDLLVCLGAFFLGLLSRGWLLGEQAALGGFSSFESAVLLFLLLYTLHNAALALTQTYPVTRLRSFAEMASLYFKSACLLLLFMLGMSYMIRAYIMSRFWMISACICVFLLMLFKEWFVRQLLAHFRKKGRNLRNVILVGASDAQISEIVDETNTNHMLGLRAIGAITLGEDGRGKLVHLPNLGRVENMTAVLEKDVVDCVIFFNKSGYEGQIKDAIWQCEQVGVEVWLRVEFIDYRIHHVDISHLRKVPFLSFRAGPQNHAALMVKSAVDWMGGLALLILLSPILAVTAILVKLTSPGPVLFKQHRVGINGRRFVLYKFRSMVNNAEQLRETLKHHNEMTGPMFKISKDPRITPFGRFIRKMSIDELPQLWNVLRREMSLVGPRPMLPREAENTHGWARRRLSMRPGLTCLWQVMGRNKIKDFEEWVRLDLRYIDEWSLWLDLKILLKTIPVVLRGTGI